MLSLGIFLNLAKSASVKVLTNIMSACTINKKGPYFVTVHGGSPGTLTFSEKNYRPTLGGGGM